MSTLTLTQASDLFRAPPERFIDVGAGEAACRSVGSGPDVLFVHGWPVSGATFRTLMPYLVDHVTCHVIDLPSAGSSRFDGSTQLSVAQHIKTVRAVVDALGFDQVALVGHDSGGLLARYAMAGDNRLNALGLINTEVPNPGWRFKAFVGARHLPGFGTALGWACGKPTISHHKYGFGSAFANPSCVAGEFDEFFLKPLSTDSAKRAGAVKVLKSFDMDDVRGLPAVHRRITAPVQLVWGAKDPFFPLEDARLMVDTFPDAELAVIENGGLFCHEEKPVEVAEALLSTLTGARH